MRRGLPFLATAIALLASPFYLDVFQVGLLTQGLIWGILGLSVWFLLRILSQPSFGHAAYFGVAAYVAGLAASRWDITNIFAVLALAIAITCVVALPIAVVASRLGSIGFLLITLAFAEMLRSLATRWRSVGGSDGLVGVVRPHAGPLPIDLEQPVSYFYFTLGATMLCLLMLWTVKRSALGGVLVGIRESEGRMRALGYRVGAYKVFAFAFSAGIAAVAGVLHAYLIRFVSPEELSPLISARGLIIVVIAGTLVWMPILIAALLTFGEDIASSQTPHWMALMGIVYVLVALFGGQSVRLPGWLRVHRTRTPTAPAPEVLILQEKS